jgi:hypothetical protein
VARPCCVACSIRAASASGPISAWSRASSSWSALSCSGPYEDSALLAPSRMCVTLEVDESAASDSALGGGSASEGGWEASGPSGPSKPPDFFLDVLDFADPLPVLSRGVVVLELDFFMLPVLPLFPELLPRAEFGRSAIVRLPGSRPTARGGLFLRQQGRFAQRSQKRLGAHQSSARSKHRKTNGNEKETSLQPSKTRYVRARSVVGAQPSYRC